MAPGAQFCSRECCWPASQHRESLMDMTGPHLPSPEPHSTPGTGLCQEGMGKGPPLKPEALHAENTEPHPSILLNSPKDFIQLIRSDHRQPLQEAGVIDIVVIRPFL